MTGYHSEQTVYTYTDVGQISTMTAPNSKTWDFDYDALGRVTQWSNPNGTTSAYSYDSRNALTKIGISTQTALTTQRSAEEATPPSLPVDGEGAVHCAGIRCDDVHRQFLASPCLCARRE